MKKETIYLAGGCFWGTENYMQGVDGVLETRVGYALGEKPLWNPPLKESVTYEEVCNHSGHAEAVEVVFDAEKISLTEVLREYCYTIDPTSLGRQGMDIGIQYPRASIASPRSSGRRHRHFWIPCKRTTNSRL